jgi:hypothetical protein
MELEGVINLIDRSGLSNEQQIGFQDWWNERLQMQVSIQNALSKGQSVKALMVSKTLRSKPEYILRVGI